MKVKLFEWANSSERDLVESLINELLAGGCKVVNVLQSSTPSHVSVSVWYEEDHELLNQSLVELALTIRAFVTLNQSRDVSLAPISSIKELTEKSAQELLKYKGFGKKSLADVRQRLAHYGLHLRGEPIARIDS